MKFEVILEIEDPQSPKRSGLSKLFNPFKDMELTEDEQWVEKQEIKAQRLAKIEGEGIKRLSRILSNEGIIVHQVKRVD